MSSMDTFSPRPAPRYRPFLKTLTLTVSALALPLFAPAAPAMAQDAATWDRARAAMVARAPGDIGQAVARWETLVAQQSLGFDAYADFILAYPGFPQQDLLQRRAEAALGDEPVAPDEIVAFFDRNPALTNAARGRYALALATLQRPEAAQVARTAWRGGSMSGPTELYLEGLFGAQFIADDQRQRMDAVLWDRDSQAAKRQLVRLDAGERAAFQSRVMFQDGNSAGVDQAALRDPGYVYDLTRSYRQSRQTDRAVQLLTTRPAYAKPAHDGEAFIGEMLRVARDADAGSAARIAGSVDDLFEPGADISKMSYRLRDDYTSLMWLGGTKALWERGDAATAAPLFYRYGAAAQTPQTRSKGFYWAAKAAARAGNKAERQRYLDMAAAYPDRFYGQLALTELGRAIPPLGSKPAQEPTAQDRAAFNAQPLTRAVAEVSRGAPWRTGIRFYREIAQQAHTETEHMLRVELARQIGRRDLAVNIAEAAGSDGLDQFVAQGFPTLDTPPGTYWTMAHAIARQESQFAQNAISHAGARGLMQLMPGTAREQAGKLGLSYDMGALISDPVYNVQLGNGYFERMLDYYDGSYPLAIAAYNAGPGNVNKFLRANGDPRQGGIDWVTWIERIPIFETKNYVQRVIENAATYEQLYPQRARTGTPRTAGDFLR